MEAIEWTFTLWEDYSTELERLDKLQSNNIHITF